MLSARVLPSEQVAKCFSLALKSMSVMDPVWPLRVVRSHECVKVAFESLPK